MLIFVAGFQGWFIRSCQLGWRHYFASFSRNSIMSV